MTDRLSRRTLLTTIATTALAGCPRDGADTDQTPQTEGDPDTSTGTPTEMPSPTRTATPTDTATPTPPSSVEASWPVPAHDPGRSNYASGVAGPTEQVAPLWERSPSADLTTPVVAREQVYVGDVNGRVHAFDARTGDGRWVTRVGQVARTPRVHNGVVVVPTAAGIRALNATDGSKAWRIETAPLGDVVVAGSGVYYVTDPDTDQSEEQPDVVARDIASGEERWRQPISSPWEPTIFVGGGRVFVPSGPYDSRPWTFGVESGEFLLDRKPRRGADFPTSRCYHAGTRYMVEGFFGSIEARAVTDDGSEWSAGVEGGGTFGISGGDASVYVAQNTYEQGVRLFALSAASGATQWEQLLSAYPGRPVVTDDTVLVNVDGHLRCFDTAEGEERWQLTERLVGDTFVVVDDLVVTTRDDILRVLRPP